MALRPYWSGQIRVSLVSLAVNVFTATKRSSQLPLHELQRSSGERIHHQNVTEDGKRVDDDDIVKGYEVEKGEYVLLEREELENVKLPSSDELELEQFVDLASIPLKRIERPYYVAPDGKKSEEVYTVLTEALRESGKMGIGQITLRGREELCGLYAGEDGLMLATLRYDIEFQKPPELPELKKKPKGEYVTLARQLIRENSSAPQFKKFQDHYHEALQELIDAKKSHRKPRYKTKEAKTEKVVDFMDALRRSLKNGKSGKSHATPKQGAHRRRA